LKNETLWNRSRAHSDRVPPRGEQSFINRNARCAGSGQSNLLSTGFVWPRMGVRLNFGWNRSDKINWFVRYFVRDGCDVKTVSPSMGDSGIAGDRWRKVAERLSEMGIFREAVEFYTLK